MSVPTQGEEYAKLMENLRHAQENCAMLAHLTRDEDRLRAQGWLGISELIKRMLIQVTKLAMRKLQ